METKGRPATVRQRFLSHLTVSAFRFQLQRVGRGAIKQSVRSTEGIRSHRVPIVTSNTDQRPGLAAGNCGQQLIPRARHASNLS